MGMMVDFKGYLLKSDLKLVGLVPSRLSEEFGYAEAYITTSCNNDRIDYDVLTATAHRIGTTPKRYLFETSIGNAKITYENMSYSDKIRSMPTKTLLQALRDISLELYSRKEN